MIIVQLLFAVFLYYLIKDLFTGGHAAVLALMLSSAIIDTQPLIEIVQDKDTPGMVKIIINDTCTAYNIPEKMVTDETYVDELDKHLQKVCGKDYGI